MIKYLYLLLALSFLPLEANTTAEVRVAAFLPSKKLFRDIYGDVLVSYQVEASTSIYNCFYIFGNIEEINQAGNVVDCGRSSLNILSGSVGPKYVYCMNTYVDLYAGIGLDVAWSHISNHCNGFYRTEYNTSFGGVAKVGVNAYIYQGFFVDVFADYQYQPAFRNAVNIGGFKLGLGLGCSF